MPIFRLRSTALTAAAVIAGALFAGPLAAADSVPAPLPVKVLIVNMFKFEAAPWLKALHDTRQIRVPGLSPDYPVLTCDARAVCEMTTAMGHANAAASLMAVLYSEQLDLRQTWILIAGIAGIDPARGTLGTAAWARYAVDMGLAHEIDARDMPRGWKDGYFGVNTNGPGQKPRFDYGTEVYRLNEALLQRALQLSGNVTLEDDEQARRFRARYPSAPANAPPRVTQCDTLSGDTWWSGSHLREHARHWMRLLTDGAGEYCTTQQEDNASLLAIQRAASEGRADFQRVAILRTASDFDSPAPRQGAFDALHAQLALQGPFRIACDNLVIAGMPLVDAIADHWSEWQQGVPPP